MYGAEILDRSSDFCGFLDCRTSLTGELQFVGTLRIDGNVHGSIKTSDTLVVGAKARIDGDISAGEVQLFGTVHGNVNCGRRLQICDGGYLCGDVRTSRLVIEEGGRFEGLSFLSDSITEEALPESELNREVEEPPKSIALGRSVLPHMNRWVSLRRSLIGNLAELMDRTRSAINWQRP